MWSNSLKHWRVILLAIVFTIISAALAAGPQFSFVSPQTTVYWTAPEGFGETMKWEPPPEYKAEGEGWKPPAGYERYAQTWAPPKGWGEPEGWSPPDSF